MKNICLLVLFISAGILNAQQISSCVLNTGGQTHSNGTIYLEWNLGEVAIQEYNAPNYKMSEGFLSDDIEIITSVKNEGLDMDLEIFPNPATDYIKIRKPEGTLYATLISPSGHAIMNEVLENETTTLNLSALPVGTYLLHIRKNYDQFNTYTIVKSQKH